MRVTLPRLLAATPDAITAAIYFTAWIAPSVLGPQYVKNLMLVMLIEFIVMHSGAFYAGIASIADISRLRRLLMLTGLSLFYTAFILAFSAAFDSTWPIFAFAWLFASRFLHILLRPEQGPAETAQMMGLWVTSVAAYIFGALGTVMLPLPALGITPEFIASMQLTGSGEWIERPYTVLAFGALYFSIQALAKFALSSPSSSRVQRAPG